MPKQTTDISGDPFAIAYAGIGETWTIARGVAVTGATVGIYSAFADSRAVNNGDVNGGVVGVGFQPGGATGSYAVVNKAKGAIGGQNGIFVDDFAGSLAVRNDGKVSGTNVGVYTVGSGDVAVENTGLITGGQYALNIGVATGAVGPTIDNFGDIVGGLVGIVTLGLGNVEARIVNHKGGLISGELTAVTSLTRLSLKNEGKLDGRILASSLDDTIINKKTIAGDVDLGAGLDTFKSKGNAKAGLIDTNLGNDLVVLGDKADKLLFGSALDAATNVDTVKKFDSGKDAIYLDDEVFSTIAPGPLSSAAFHKGTSAADADDRIIYDKASGALYYDPDGTGALAQTQFAKLDGGPKLKASDFTIGEYSLLFE